MAAVDQFIDSGKQVFSALEKLGFKDAVPPLGRRYSIPTDLINRDKSSAMRIDHVLANDAIEVVAAAVAASADLDVLITLGLWARFRLWPMTAVVLALPETGGVDPINKRMSSVCLDMPVFTWILCRWVFAVTTLIPSISAASLTQSPGATASSTRSSLRVRP